MREFNEPKRRVPLNKGKKKESHKSEKKTANRERVNGEKKNYEAKEDASHFKKKIKKRTFLFSAVFFLCHTDNK